MSWFGSFIGSGIGEVVAKVATPFTDAWVKSKQSAAASHKVDKETDRDITVEAYRADVALGLGQRLLADADRTHWSTRWIRPAFAALAFVWAAAELYFWMWAARPGMELDPVVKYLLAGIVGSLFLLRPFEKNKRADIATSAAQSASQPSLLSKLRGNK